MIEVYDDGYLRIVPERLRVYKDGLEAYLGINEWRLLLLLMKYAPKGFTTIELMEIQNVRENTVWVHICRLRKSIGREYIYEASQREGYYFQGRFV